MCVNFSQGKKTDNLFKSRIKKDIEKWIKETHADVKWEYQDSRYNNIKYRGWKHLKISECTFGPHLHMGLWAAKAHVYLYSIVTML